MKKLSVVFTTLAITTDCNKPFECNELTLYNVGTQIAMIDGIIPLFPGAAITYPGKMSDNNIDINVTIVNLTFPRPYPNGCKVAAIQKNYRL